MATHPCIEANSTSDNCNGCVIYHYSLCRRFQTILKKLVNNLNHNYASILKADREDIVENTVEAVLNGIDRFEGRHGAKFSTWVYRIYRNKLSDFFRQNGRYTINVDEAASIHNFGNHNDSKELQMKIAECFKRVLPDDQTGCIKLYLDLYITFLNGQTQREMAQSYRIKANTLNQKIRRCRELISQLFVEYLR